MAIAVIPEGTEGETTWTAYLLNIGSEKLETVIVNSSGYGEVEGRQVKTATLRWFFGDVEPGQACKIEEMTAEVSMITNEFWVSYYIGSEIFDKKYVFVLDTLSRDYLVHIPVLNSMGVLIK